MAYDFDDINLARRIKAFVTKEVTPGTPQFPAAADFICPAGDPSINQTLNSTDSQEMADTLDKLDKFPGAYSAAEWELPMYLRLAGFGALPQGHAMLRSMQGLYASGLTAQAGSSGATSLATTIPYVSASEAFPPVGVIQIGTEKIRYAGNDGSSFTDCTRGYDSTTAASIASNANITLLTQVYKQDPSAEKFTFWLMTDWFLQFVTGATINSGTVDLKNEDGVKFDLKGNGTRMGFAAVGQLAEAAVAGATTIKVELPDSREFAKSYSIGAPLQNKTTGANNGGAGFVVTAVDTDNNTLTLATPVPTGGWSAGDTIMGYLPDAAPIGDVVLNRDTKILIDGAEGSIRTTSLSISLPKDYKSDELGTVYPKTIVPGTRDITMTLESYFRTPDTLRFGEGFSGEEKTIEIQFGSTPGHKASIYMPRMKMESPSLKRDSGVVAITAKGSALGSRTTTSVGENSLVLGLE